MHIRFLAPLGLVALMTTVAAGSGWQLDLEASMVQAGRIDVRVPGNGGTEFSFVDDLATDDDVSFRARLSRRLSDRQHLSVLVAPLRLYADGSIDREVLFNGDTFAAAVDCVGPSNLVTFMQSFPPQWKTRTPRFHLRGGDPDKDREMLVERSPYHQADNIRIPMLIAQGAQADAEGPLLDAGIDPQVGTELDDLHPQIVGQFLQILIVGISHFRGVMHLQAAHPRHRGGKLEPLLDGGVGPVALLHEPVAGCAQKPNTC